MNQTQQKSLTVERVFDATPEELFNACTDPATFKTWYHPMPGMELEIHEFDAREGGRIHFDMPMPGGRKGHATKGIFHVLKPHTRIVFGPKDKSSLSDITISKTPKGAKMTVTWSSNV